MGKQIPWEHIISSLRGREENQELNQWFSESKANRELYNDLQDIYSVTGNLPDEFKADNEAAWQLVETRLDQKNNLQKIVRWSLQAAASIILIAVGIGIATLFDKSSETISNSYTEVFSPYGHKTMVLLPDSSKVWLNGNSKLTYNNNFRQERNVTLEGEALFDVKKMPKKQFTVHSGDLDLKVYGTKFNYKNYPSDSKVEVSLVEGSIGLFKNDKLVKKMEPGEAILYLPDENRFEQFKGNMAQITSWQSDELVIENQSIDEIAKYLERWYGVEINLGNGLDHESKLSFKVKAESLRELLFIVNKITPIKYEIEGKKVVLTGIER